MEVNAIVNVFGDMESGLVCLSFKIGDVVSTFRLDTTSVRAMAAALNISANAVDAAELNARKN